MKALTISALPALQRVRTATARGSGGPREEQQPCWPVHPFWAAPTTGLHGSGSWSRLLLCVTRLLCLLL